jgi:hypothetical protein
MARSALLPVALFAAAALGVAWATGWFGAEGHAPAPDAAPIANDGTAAPPQPANGSAEAAGGGRAPAPMASAPTAAAAQAPKDPLADRPTACLRAVDRDAGGPLTGVPVYRCKDGSAIAFTDDRGLAPVPLVGPEQLALPAPGYLTRMVPTRLGSSEREPQDVPMVRDVWSIARTLARHPRPLGGDTQRATGASKLSLTGEVINNREAEAHHLRIQRKPEWLRARVPGGEGYERLKKIIDEHRLHTVCQEASCPNMGECWGRGTATIMILGDTGTRACGFCNIKTGKPPVYDLDEPRRVAESLALMKLKHVVITSVNRDELADGGAAIWAETIRRVHESCPEMSVEILVGDFQGDEKAIQTVCDARPEIISHNMETVHRMHPAVRPQAK